MAEAAELDEPCFQTTDGGIALINLESARSRAWSRFHRDPQRPGIAESVLEFEHLTGQFAGDLSALIRQESLSEQLALLDPSSARTALIQAQVASALHRFSDARHHLARASEGGAPSGDVERALLAVDQACGMNLDAVLDKRRGAAVRTGCLEDQVALGALLADLGAFDEADQTYRRALRDYQDVSPFAVAWVYFQLGMLWGELIPEPREDRAAGWYRKAIACLPSYVKARVHLAEIVAADGSRDEAEATLRPALASGDPEVSWRLADVLTAVGRFDEARRQLEAARSGFEALLDRHLLAFADHGAEFYAGSGGDAARALELARVNLNNRPTLRAFQQAYRAAVAAGSADAASEILAGAARRWGHSPTYRLSSSAQVGSVALEGLAPC
ncbi:hypothetical protein CIW48_28190 [Methylobacterium sp. P1-11]|uniref:hypothetical protein n=1 Tax=Methylobacterium sp. P1-11 TaxID=2024616 RepID=UPI0011ED09EC|nr:hypothetical protein [Methylobacterium sp. P1-11]KAA0115658.1 hypothetical protein CIW48_28190 [Methylobacterium sp. P1-11]